MKQGLIVLATVALAACSPSKLAYGQVKSAMLDAGLSEPNAACMATRMTDRLSLVQLNKLKQLRVRSRACRTMSLPCAGSAMPRRFR